MIKFRILWWNFKVYIHYDKCKHEFNESEVRDMTRDPKCVHCGSELSKINIYNEA